MMEHKPLTAYQMILGLSTDDTAPDHYQLLHLEHFENDEQAIRDSAITANAELLKWQNSEYYTDVHRLMDEVAVARDLLLDAKQKAKYDARLRRHLGIREPKPDAEVKLPNPYQKMLGLAEEITAPDHYQLLGLEHFEEDEQAIRNGAFDADLKLLEWQASKYQQAAARLADEVTLARDVLLDAKQKADYDAGLHRQLGVESPETVTEAVPPGEHDEGLGVAVEPAEPEYGQLVAEEVVEKEPLPPVVDTQEAATCPSCSRATPAAESWAPISVTIKENGDLDSSVCHIRQSRSLTHLRLSIRADRLDWRQPASGYYFSRQAAVLIAVGVFLVPMIFCLLLQLLTTNNCLAPVIALNAIAPMAAAVTWWFYVPKVASAEEAAWLLIVPHLLSGQRAKDHLSFIEGLAEASEARLRQPSPRRDSMLVALAEARLRRETAEKRGPVVQNCVAKAREFASKGLVPSTTVGMLFRLAIADQLVLGTDGQQLLPLLRQLLDDCLGNRLPLRCLDIALGGVQQADHLAPTDLSQSLFWCCEVCRERGLSAADMFALTTKSKSLSQFFSVMPASTSSASALAFLFALQRVCPEGMAAHGGATVFEFTSPEQMHGLKQCPDLLALSHDDPITLRMSGFYFSGKRFLAKPKISVSKVSGGHEVEVGGQRFFYNANPGGLAGHLVAWSFLYFSKLLPALVEEMNRKSSTDRVSRARGMLIHCPHCDNKYVHAGEDAAPSFENFVQPAPNPLVKGAGIVLTSVATALAVVTCVLASLAPSESPPPTASDDSRSSQPSEVASGDAIGETRSEAGAETSVATDLAEAENAAEKATSPEKRLVTASKRNLGASPPLAIAPFDARQAEQHRLAWAEHRGIPQQITNSIGMRLILIPPGEFLMGSPEEEAGRNDDEYQHSVRITKPFYLGVYEVAQGEYERVMGENPSEFSSVSGEDTRRFPVEMVSWEDAVGFCRKLSEMPEENRTGRVYRLPTEAEWEYACRAGTITAFHCGDSLASTQANFHGNLRHSTTVGSYEPNAWGLYNMHGNVSEWCRDWYGVKYFADSPIDDPTGPTSGTRSRVFRGGCWGIDAGNCRSANRSRFSLSSRFGILGFRAALVPTDDTKLTEAATADEKPQSTPLTYAPERYVPQAEKQPSDADETSRSTPPADGPKPYRPQAKKQASMADERPQSTPLMDAPIPNVAEATEPETQTPPLAVAPFTEAESKQHQQRWASFLQSSVEETNSIGMQLVLIPPGEFQMGSSANEVDRSAGEDQQHQVRITKPFYLGMYEVTQEEYKRVMGSNPSSFSAVPGQDTSRFPVETISWRHATEFCRRLSRIREEYQAGRDYRLPTEAEWEYACRAGTTAPFHFSELTERYGVRGRSQRYPISGLAERYFNCLSRSRSRNVLRRTTTVGSYQPSPFGLYDMHGNVCEWCQDWYATGYYRNSPVDDPTGPTSGGSERVVRGGSWQSDASSCRSASRDKILPSRRDNYLGFRVAVVVRQSSGGQGR